jgi:hypothetical protein
MMSPDDHDFIEIRGNLTEGQRYVLNSAAAHAMLPEVVRMWALWRPEPKLSLRQALRDLPRISIAAQDMVRAGFIDVFETPPPYKEAHLLTVDEAVSALGVLVNWWRQDATDWTDDEYDDGSAPPPIVEIELTELGMKVWTARGSS